MILNFKEVFVLPLRWVNILIAVFFLLFASGCSTVLVDSMGLKEAKEMQDTEAKEEKKEEKKEEEAKENEEEDDSDTQSANKDDEVEETAEPEVEAEELTASHLTFYADTQDWAEESREEDEDGFEYYYFTPGGEDVDYAKEMIQVETYPGVQEYLTSFAVAQGIQESMQEEYEDGFHWQVLDQDRDNILAKISLAYEEESRQDGMVRVFSDDTGIYALIYYTVEEWTEEKQELWKELLIRARGSGVIL